MLQAVGRALTWTPVTVASVAVLVVILGPPVGEAIKHASVRSVVALAPVKHDWKVTSVKIDGPDIVVSGSMVKRWACDYQPPPRALDAAGAHYIVESASPTKVNNWPVSNKPYNFGPWRVVGAAGQKVMLYQEDECLGVSVFTWLGAIDTRAK